MPDLFCEACGRPLMWLVDSRSPPTAGYVCPTCGVYPSDCDCEEEP